MRAILTFLVFCGTYALVWLAGLFLPLGGASWIGSSLALVIALAAAGLFWSRFGDASRSVLGTAAYGALILGGIGFAAGFFGPMLLAPDANQGPMLGIFITGPGGAILGTLLGLVFGLMRSQR
jgi:hypothetical protein